MHKLNRKQKLPITLDEAWSFFSSPHNLNEITPPELVFEIISDVPDEMYEGLMIEYRLKPMLKVPVKWVTEITHIREKSFFVDEQRSGPYKLWHHEHHFEPVERGILMTDILHYEIGKSIFGYIAGEVFVHKKVKEIFDYRFEKLKAIFPENNHA